jgi:AcrR family transcriptional regulator
MSQPKVGHEAATSGTGGGPRVWRYGELTRDDLVDAGLRITRRQGFDHLSMRKLAAELGSPSMNTYYYVRNKGQLLDLVGDAVLGEIVLPPADVPWDRWLTQVFTDGRTVLLRYPGVAQHLLRRVSGLPNERRLYQGLAATLRQGGFDEATSDRAQRTLAYLLFGAVTSELATATATAANEPDTMSFSDDAEVFDFGLELMLEGLRQLRTDPSE